MEVYLIMCQKVKKKQTSDAPALRLHAAERQHLEIRKRKKYILETSFYRLCASFGLCWTSSAYEVIQLISSLLHKYYCYLQLRATSANVQPAT